MTDAPNSYLNVRQTAQRLGVHENTVRNFARDGVLESIRLPGSRYLRFNPDDVERLRGERATDAPTALSQRQIPRPDQRVNAADLEQWARTKDAQANLSLLVRRLLASSPRVSAISAPVGDATSSPGWDVRADSDGSAPYLPRGSLRMELSIHGRPAEKFAADYEKRRDNPLGDDPANCAFVFVTLRRATRAKELANTYRTEGVFADVVVLDVDDIEGWLDATPDVHVWISEHLGYRPNDVMTLDAWWNQFSTQTNPRLPSELFLAGRESQVKRLRMELGGTPRPTTVQGTSRDDAIAFVYAALEADDDLRDTRHPLVVSTQETFNRLVDKPSHLALIPTFDLPASQLPSRTDRHWIIQAVDRAHVLSPRRVGVIDLPQLDRSGVADALRGVGVEFHAAERHAARARRSLPAFIRGLGNDHVLIRPKWVYESGLPPLVLAGAWTTEPADTALLAQIAGMPWSELEPELLTHQASDDPPFVRRGNEWRLTSPEESVLVAYNHLSSDQLRLSGDVAVRVLAEPDPTRDWSLGERAAAMYQGDMPQRASAVMRGGLAQGLALLGAVVDDQELADGYLARDHADAVVAHILKNATQDESGVTWQSLADVMPLLAEASPVRFLTAAENDLDSARPVLATLFQDADQDSWGSATSPHTGLLWALERLCWSPDPAIFHRAIQLLARLSDIDPGGRLSNRPLESLHSVLSGWIHHVSVSAGDKILAIESIVRHYPDVGWKLVLEIWPEEHDALIPPARPDFREWYPGERTVLIKDYLEHIQRVVGFGLKFTEERPERWVDLIQRLSALPPAERRRVLDTLDEHAEAGALSSTTRAAVWDTLNKVANEHEAYAEADWAVDAETIQQMRRTANALEPSDRLDRFAYLFDWRPALPGVDPRDITAQDQELARQRTAVLHRALEVGSLAQVHQLATRVNAPPQLGDSLGSVATTDFDDQLLAWLDASEPKVREVAQYWARRKMYDSGPEWLRETLASDALAADGRAALALVVPGQRDFWDLMVDVDSEFADEYWSHASPIAVPPEDADTAARELMAHGRPWHAADLLGMRLDRSDDASSVSTETINRVLDAAKTVSPEEQQTVPLGYSIGILLKEMRSRGVPVEKLAAYEFIFFRILRRHYQPRALYTRLCTDPQFFVELASYVYRAKRDSSRQLSDDERDFSHQAFDILNHWHGLPGTRDDNTIDSEQLAEWVNAARLGFADIDREDVGDELVGQVLSNSPTGTDGVWPHEAVRHVIELAGNQHINVGVRTGAFNKQSISWRGAYEGGEQERARAEEYLEWARATAGVWPRTSRILTDVGEALNRQAHWHDQRASKDADS